MPDYPDFTGKKVDVVLRPEWAAIQGTDKTFFAEATTQPPGDPSGNALIDYTVPAGKTLYISQTSHAIFAISEPVDGDKNQIGELLLLVVTGMTLDYSAGIGGNGGSSLVFPKPIVIPAGSELIIRGINRSGHGTGSQLTAAGWEI